MRETRFINQMKEKWAEFEQILKSPSRAPDKLYDVFIHLMNDLSYARTFYANRSVRVYLNGLAQQIFVNIYKNRKSKRNKLLTFWTDDLPQLVFEAKRAFLIAFLVFLLSFLIGVLSSAMDTGFAEVILGEYYVEMTKENIASGDPMAVYKQKGEMGMSIGIAGNNLFVAFLTFVLGIFFTIGSLIILVSNGVMVGAFQYFFIERDLFWESFLTIWIHGTLEISAIIIAGAAGITMGKGLVFPGSFSRAKAFQKSARRGLKIMIGIVPIIILAAFFEGYLTRHTETPNLIRGLFIAVNLLFVLGYFVFYPRWKARKGFSASSNAYQLRADRKLNVQWLDVKNVAQMFGDTIVLCRKYFKTLLSASVFAALLYTGMAYFLSADFQSNFYFPQRLFGTIFSLSQFFTSEHWWMGLAFWLPLSLVVSLLYKRIFSKSSPQQQWMASFRLSFGLAIILICLSFFLLKAQLFWALFLLLPFLFLFVFTLYKEQGNLARQFQQSFSLMNKSYGKGIGLFFSISLIALLLFGALDTMIFSVFFELLAWIFPFEQAQLNLVSTLALTTITASILFFVFGMYFLAFAVFYHAAKEARDAVNLKTKIEQIGQAQRIRGMERE
ncbi:MAG: stage II sporulation protein M [Bacteroidota bacterium]